MSSTYSFSCSPTATPISHATLCNSQRHRVLALGGAGIVVGLATYGYKIISALGVKLVRVTPSRGFAIELGAAFVIVTGSFLGIPLSTTHCQVGATVGVGMMEGSWRETSGVNWRLFAKVALGWVMTLVIAGLISAMLYSFGTKGPSEIYPLSQHNCIYYYGTLVNVTGVVPAITLAKTDIVDNTVALVGGYPNTGAFTSVGQISA